MRTILLTGIATLGILGVAATTSHVSAREVCNDDGRCWHENTDVGRDIVRGLVTGRSGYRDHDWHHDRYDHDRDFDHDRGYDDGYRR